MKLSAHLTEAEIKQAIAAWLEHQGLATNADPADVRLEIVRGDDDPRSPKADSVAATALFDR